MDFSNDVYTIHHVESLRREASYYWPLKHHEYSNGAFRYEYGFRPALNLRALIASLSDPAGDAHPDDGLVLGKRKHLEPDCTPSKRIRVDHATQGISQGERRTSAHIPSHRQIYPSYWESLSDRIDEVFPTAYTSFLQVYQFGLNLRYNKVVDTRSNNHASDEAAKRKGWVEEEEVLSSLLQDRQSDASLSRDIDLGTFSMARYYGRFLAVSGQLPKHSPVYQQTINEYSEKWLFILPDIPWPDGITEAERDDSDSNVQSLGMHDDFIAACAVLQSQDRAKLEASLRLHVLSEGTYDPTCDFPFELRAHFTLSLAIPQTYNPFNISLAQNKLNELEGLQRRLFCFLSKTPPTYPVSNGAADDDSNVTIPFFLNSLRPAPPLPQNAIYELLQPDGLHSSLMPFQRRTVAWMLEREGKDITSLGNVIPLDHLKASTSTSRKYLPPFWEEIKMGGRNFFFNHLTSVLSPEPPDPHAALGGILAEEPGLGKTMECLALMLLNPALERNPSNKRWDPEAKLHVKEVKTTLIVTPPALASQWADELAAHAPDLKVFVYEGWTKVKVPITEADAEAERAKLGGRRVRKTNGKGKRKARDPEVDDDSGFDTQDEDDDLDMVLDWPNYINQFDVCITTYKVLQTDISVARVPPERSRRKTVEYKNLTRQRSPLVICEWYRVIMDEVQMMGMGKSEEMVGLIPRLSSFAVSGTPARSQVSDLIGVLRFLRIDDLVTPKRMWNKLLKPGFKELFASLFQTYSVRTLKSSVQSELTIPQQRRYLVNIELGRVERHVGYLAKFVASGFEQDESRQVYDRALEEALAELGLDARGVAAEEGWEVDASVLRSVLRKLRGICTHPLVGQLVRQGDRLHKPGALKSIADVLESMKEQNWRNLVEDRKAKILMLTRLAQLQQHCANELDRYQRALEHLLSAETEANQLVDEIKALLTQHNTKGEILKTEAQALRKTRLHNDQNDEGADKGKGNEISPEDSDLDFDEFEDAEDKGLPKTLAGEEHRAKRMALQARLRECFMVLHKVKFLQGDVYHVLGSSYLEREDAAYADAESLRKDLLKSTEEAANKVMRRLSVAATEKRVTGQALQIPLPFMKGGGIRSTHLFEEANDIIEDVLNEQAVLIWEWRTKIVELLTRTLGSSGEQADGEEYARTLDTQGEAEAYLQAYAILLADRREAIAAERTLLAVHEGREKKARKTKTAARAKFQPRASLQVKGDVEVQPEHEVLYGQLLEQRRELQLYERALKSVMVDLSAVVARAPKENDPEKIIARSGAADLRALIASLLDLNDKLDADLAVLRKAFNDRIVYFRQLQEISDTVAEVEWDGPLADAVESASLDVANLAAKINTSRARQRYLEHLAMDGSRFDEEGVCILCQCEFFQGFITHCAHMFCEGCMKAWIARGRGRACPVCRAPINPEQLQRFTTQEDQPPPPRPVMADGELVPVSRRKIEYNMINPDLFTDIQTMESNGNYGSKIQTLVRHLLHIQLVDPGAKSIVFSAWADSLTIVEHALQSNGIPCVRLDQSQGKGKDGGAKRFRVDPSLQVLLLHGERDNAGLNVTCASRVFLLESVVNHGFEVQAIARIDRLGQTRATEVFCYYAEDTVEKNILDLAARQGLSLYTKENSAGSLNVTSLATDSEKNLVESPTKSSKKGQPAQKGDFIFRVNDMLAILFPHMFEDIEYLLPADARVEASPSSEYVAAAPAPVLPSTRRVYVNAEAGPSRLSGTQ